MVSLKQL